uniref:Uncharacterized protein n=1 Tax=Arundo donax TaxID=35708 RepID=A0A0A9CZQ9_ARUDO
MFTSFCFVDALYLLLLSTDISYTEDFWRLSRLIEMLLDPFFCINKISYMYQTERYAFYLIPQIY